MIQRANDAQVQALASGDAALMAQTATSDYYQQIVQANRALLDAGVTSIQLVRIEWGAIDIAEGAATVTTWETWTTVFQDGTAEQSRDRNVYTLVQLDGDWKIQADDHPEAQQPSAGGGRPGGSVPPTSQPSISDDSVSHNWAGYTATGGRFTGVSATWSVPEFAPNSPPGADATWVGIGGVTSSDLIQAGTQQATSGGGTTQYQAWFELLPEVSQPVSLAIYPGDSISVSIVQQDQARWQISFVNNTTGRTYQLVQQYVSSLSSAEWIEEAPSLSIGRLLPLDDFGSVSFGQAMALRRRQRISSRSSDQLGSTARGRIV